MFSTHTSDLHHFAARVDHVPVTDTVDGALVEGHDVSGERARLVAEHVLHLQRALLQCGKGSWVGRTVDEHPPVRVPR